MLRNLGVNFVSVFAIDISFLRRRKNQQMTQVQMFIHN